MAGRAERKVARHVDAPVADPVAEVAAIVTAVRTLTNDDLPWAVERLARRRAALVPFAPVYWRPAAHAEQAHRRYLGYLLTRAGGVGVRSDDDLLIAAPAAGGGWTIDDAAVADGEWPSTGQALWDAVGALVAGPVRFVCPVPEVERTAFARERGLQLADSWWHVVIDLPDGSRPADLQHEIPQVDGCVAQIVAAPRIYDPGGPTLYLTEVTEPDRALPAARIEAARLGCPIVVVGQPAADDELGATLRDAGYRRHCDFFTGELPRSPMIG